MENKILLAYASKHGSTRENDLLEKMNSATRAVVSVMGAVMGLAGLEHGIGEIWQGNQQPAGIMFQSWADHPFFASVNGEPAMSLIPNLLVSGIVSVLVSLAILFWVTICIRHKQGGLVLIMLSIILLLVGGGIFPPVLSLLIGLVATRIDTPPSWPRAILPDVLVDMARSSWKWVLGICLAAWLSLFPGSLLLDYYLKINDTNLTLALMLLAFGSLFLAVLTAFISDGRSTDK